MDPEKWRSFIFGFTSDFNINKRVDVRDKEFMNKITKGVFELGSIFKTFTIALALEENSRHKNSDKNIKNSIKCSVHKISDINNFLKI